MKSMRFLHTADLHLGSPFQGISERLPDHWLALVRKAADEVFERIVDLAIAQRVDLVTVAGDLFDSSQASMAAHFALYRGFERLKEANIPVVVSHGNHDPLRGPVPLAWPDNVHVLRPIGTASSGLPVVDDVILTLPSGNRVQVAGFSYSESELRINVVSGYQRRAEVDFAIALLHGAVGEAGGDHANYAPASLRDLAAKGFDVWALGHIHLPQVLSERSPLVFYPGNPQGRHIKEDGIRGVRVVDVQSGGAVSSQFWPTFSVGWQRCEIGLDGAADAAAAAALISQALTSIVEQQGGAPTIVRCRLTGQTALHSQLTDPAVLEDLQNEVMARNPDVWIERCDVATRPPVDLSALAESYEFVGEFLRTLDACRQDPEALRKSIGPLLSEVFHKGNELPIEAVPDEALTAWVEQALAHFLRYVGEGAES